MKGIHQDVFIGIGIVIFSLFLFLQVIPMPEGASTFPNILIITFGLFGIAIAVAGVKKGKSNEGDHEEEKFDLTTIKLPLYSLVLITLYVVLINFLGFFVTTTIFLIVFMLFYKIKSLKAIVITVITVNLIMYLLFVYQLNVQLPKGFLL